MQDAPPMPKSLPTNIKNVSNLNQPTLKATHVVMLTASKPLQLTNALQNSSVTKNQLNLTKVFKTLQNAKWALKTFESWRNARNQRFPDDHIRRSLHEHLANSSVYNTHLTHFAVEVRKASGEYYPPSSQHQLLSGII